MILLFAMLWRFEADRHEAGAEASSTCDRKASAGGVSSFPQVFLELGRATPSPSRKAAWFSASQRRKLLTTGQRTGGSRRAGGTAAAHTLVCRPGGFTAPSSHRGPVLLGGGQRLLLAVTAVLPVLQAASAGLSEAATASPCCCVCPRLPWPFPGGRHERSPPCALHLQIHSRPWPWTCLRAHQCFAPSPAAASAVRSGPPPPTAPSRCSAGKGRELGASRLTPITRTFPPPRLPSRCPRCQCPHGFNLPPPACSVQREHSLAAPPSSALWPSVLFRLASSDMSSVATTFPASVNANPSGPALCSLPRCQPAHVTVKATLSPRSSSSTPPHQYSPTVGATAAHLGDSHALALLLPVGTPPFSGVPPHRSRCCPRPGCAH